MGPALEDGSESEGEGPVEKEEGAWETVRTLLQEGQTGEGKG
jgi:hypothetical protein